MVSCSSPAKAKATAQNEGASAWWYPAAAQQRQQRQNEGPCAYGGVAQQPNERMTPVGAGEAQERRDAWRGARAAAHCSTEREGQAGHA